MDELLDKYLNNEEKVSENHLLFYCNYRKIVYN